MSLELCSESSYQSMRRWAGLPLVKCGASKIQIYLRKLTQSQARPSHSHRQSIWGRHVSTQTHWPNLPICSIHCPYLFDCDIQSTAIFTLDRIKSNSHLPVGLCQGRNHPNKVTAGWRDLLWMPGTSYTWVGVSLQPAISHSKAPTRRER